MRFFNAFKPQKKNLIQSKGIKEIFFFKINCLKLNCLKPNLYNTL